MRSLVFVVMACFLMSSGGALADETVGAIWRIEYAKNSGREPIKIRCLKSGKVLGPAGKEIGKWEQKSRIKNIVEITEGGNRNGKYELTMLDKKPPSYQGKYTDKDGKDVNIKVELLKD